jgi:hypothetical protein
MTDTAPEEISADAPTGRSLGRQIGVGLIIAAGSLLIILSVLAIWVHTVVYDTPTWRATSKTIIQDPGVQKDVAQYVTEQLYTSPKVQSQITAALPPVLKAFSPEVTNGLRQVTQAAATRLLQRPRVQNLFVDASTRAHSDMVKLLDNNGKYVSSTNGKVVLDLRTVLIDVANNAGVGSQAQSLIPADSGQITLVDSNQLGTIQTLAHLLNILVIWLPLLTVVLFVLAVWLARGFRRRALLWSAIGILVATIVLVLVRRVLGEQIVNTLVSDVTVRPALITAWYIGTDILGTINWTLFFIAAILAVGLWLSSEGKLATRLRTKLAPWIANPYYAFGVPAAVLLILIVWEPLPVFHKVIPVLLIIVLSAVGIEALRRQIAAEHPSLTSG